MEELNKIASEGGYDFSKKLEYGESRLLDPLFWQALGKACEWDKLWSYGWFVKKSHGGAWEWRRSGDIDVFWGGSPSETPNIVTFKEEPVYHALRTLEIILTEGMDKGIEYLKSIVVK